MGLNVERGVKLTILPYPSHAEENHSEVHLTARLAPTYPIQLPKLSLTVVKGLTPDEEKELNRALDAHVAANAGNVQLMGLADLAREFLQEHNSPPPLSFHEQMQKRQQQQEERRSPSPGAAGASSSEQHHHMMQPSPSLVAQGEVELQELELELGELDKKARKRQKEEQRHAGRAAAFQGGHHGNKGGHHGGRNHHNGGHHHRFTHTRKGGGRNGIDGWNKRISAIEKS